MQMMPCSFSDDAEVEFKRAFILCDFAKTYGLKVNIDKNQCGLGVKRTSKTTL